VKTLTLLLLAVILCTALVQPQDKTGRFQIFMQRLNEAGWETAYLLDTQTGRTWYSVTYDTVVAGWSGIDSAGLVYPGKEVERAHAHVWIPVLFEKSPEFPNGLEFTADPYGLPRLVFDTIRVPAPPPKAHKHK
jgi:hypothetical protein